PVVGNLAKAVGMVAIVRNDRAEDEPGKTSSTWVLVANKVEDFGKITNDLVVDLSWREAKDQAGDIPDGQFDLVVVHAQRLEENPVEIVRKLLEPYPPKLKPGGCLAVHIRTPGPNGQPSLEQAARDRGLSLIVYDEPVEEDKPPRSWVFVGPEG